MNGSHTDRDERALVDAILAFWFEPSGDRERWFKVNPALDQEIGRRFGELILPATAGRYDDWARSADGALALLVLLDQFTRNVHRGTPAAFASDAKAREIARAVLRAGLDLEVRLAHRVFVYLPFEHAECLEDQHRSIRLMATLQDESYLDYAHRHERVIARFGRFPHRNAILGRRSTSEEAAFLLEPGSSF